MSRVAIAVGLLFLLAGCAVSPQRANADLAKTKPAPPLLGSPYYPTLSSFPSFELMEPRDISFKIAFLGVADDVPELGPGQEEGRYILITWKSAPGRVDTKSGEFRGTFRRQNSLLELKPEGDAPGPLSGLYSIDDLSGYTSPDPMGGNMTLGDGTTKYRFYWSVGP